MFNADVGATMTVEQTRVLAALEQFHPQLIRIPENSELGADLLSRSGSRGRIYCCLGCHMAFAIDGSGAVDRYDVRFLAGSLT